MLVAGGAIVGVGVLVAGGAIVGVGVSVGLVLLPLVVGVDA